MRPYSDLQHSSNYLFVKVVTREVVLAGLGIAIEIYTEEMVVLQLRKVVLVQTLTQNL